MNPIRRCVMDLRHLGLPVRDERRSQQFYTDYFGFDPATARECEDGTVIIRNAYGFALALYPVGHVEPSPAFLHAGFQAAEPAEVRALMERMEADGVTIVERDEEAATWRSNAWTRTATGSRWAGTGTIDHQARTAAPRRDGASPGETATVRSVA
jgi:catechol 2,3-dioxygenase-like lactoylglutathione lyase family enzyme